MPSIAGAECQADPGFQQTASRRVRSRARASVAHPLERAPADRKRRLAFAPQGDSRPPAPFPARVGRRELFLGGARAHASHAHAMALRPAARSLATLAARRDGTVAARAFATNAKTTFGLPEDTFKRGAR